MRSLLISSFFLCAVAIQFVAAQIVYKNNNWVVGYNTQIQFRDTGVAVLRTIDTIVCPSVAISGLNGEALYHVHWPMYPFNVLGQKVIRNKYGDAVPYRLASGYLSRTYPNYGCINGLKSDVLLNSDSLLYHIYTDAVDNCQEGQINLFYSIIDPNSRDDSGTIVLLNKRLSWFISITSIAAIKHADGKSWWIVSHLQRSDSFATFLLKENTFHGPIYSKVSPDVGDLFPEYPREQEGIRGTINASMDGNKLFFVSPTGLMKVCHTYDFDRCTGKVSNPQDITPIFQDYVSDSVSINSRVIEFISGTFSPNNKYLYTSSSTRVFKINLQTPLTKTLLWRSSLPSNLIDKDGPSMSSIAPNNSIYFGKFYNNLYVFPPDSFCDGISEYISVISDPDNPDTSGQFKFKGLKIGPGGCIGFGMPVDVNHALGRSTDECVGYPPVYTAVESPLINRKTYQIYPNPATNDITLKANAGKLNGQLSFYNLSGQAVYQASLSNESTHEWNVSGLPSGIYYLRLTDGTSEPFVQKVVVSR